MLAGKLISVQTKGLEVFDPATNYSSIYYRSLGTILAKTLTSDPKRDPHLFYTASVSDKVIMKWDLRDMKMVHTIKCDLPFIRQVQLYKDYLIVGGKGGNVNCNG